MKVPAAVLVIVVAWLATGCGSDAGVESVATTSCSRMLYEGDGKPDVVVVSDFPLRGTHQSSKPMVDAIEFVLRQRGFRAGEHRVGFQSCNDTVGDEPYDTLLCRRNAHAYMAAKDVLGVIGPWNSGCAEEQIPIVSRKDPEPLAMISPSNTYAGLTRRIPGERSGAALYPDGVRSYVRVVTHDLAQGIAVAHLARRLGARRMVVLYQTPLRDSYVRGLTVPFVNAAEDLGLHVRRLPWPDHQSYRPLAATVAAARPDAVFLAGLPQGNGKTLIQDLRAALGPKIPLIAPDSFGAPDMARALGRAGEGMYVTFPGLPLEKLPPGGRRFVRAFGRSSSELKMLYAPEAAQATEVLLDAIGRSDGTRMSVVRELFATKVRDGVLGTFSFDRFGDVVPSPVAIYRFRNRQVVSAGVVRVPLDAIDR